MPLPPNLLAAILADPSADGPRLAAADWFAATGDPDRAEFIRLQLEIGAALASERDALDTEFQYGYRREAAAKLDRLDLLPKIAREYELLTANHADWVPVSGATPTFRRGFMAALAVPVADFLAHPEWVDLVPDRAIHLTEFAARLPQPPIDPAALLKPGGIEAFMAPSRYADPTPGVRALADSPHLGRIAHLDLSMNELTGAHIAAILASPHLGELRSLNVGSNKVGPVGAKAVGGCAKLARAERLSFWFGGIGPDGGAALAGSPHLTAVTDLELYANDLGDDGIAALANANGLGRLDRLGIGYNHFTAAAFEKLAFSERLTGLTRLGMSGNKGVGDEALAILGASPLGRRLTRLDIGCCCLTPEGTRRLNSPAFAALRELELKGEDSFPDRVDGAALGGNPHLAGLQSLSMEAVALGDAGLKALAEGPGAAALHTLVLDDNGIGPEGVRALAWSAKFGSLRTLSLKENRIGPEGAVVLAESPYLDRLRSVDLEDCGLGEEGMLAILRAPWMASAVEFDFGWNKLGDHFVEELARQPFLRNFISLDLGLNRIGDAGIVALANSPHVAGLRTLSLGSNRIGDDGCRALAQSPYLGNLETLILTDNPNTTAKGRMALWQRFDRPGCKFVFGFRKRIEDKRGDPEPAQPRDGFREDHDEDDEDDE